jgi:aminoglycoside phosphotransferase (APT) family kinase protein
MNAFYSLDSRLRGNDIIIDARQALALWDEACATRWGKQPVWIHGDFAIGNLLASHRHTVCVHSIGAIKLSAVIDFGRMAIGDTACDLEIAWTYLSGKFREIFMLEMDMDKDTWIRLRAWALRKATYEFARLTDKQCPEACLQIRIIEEVMHG